MKINPITVISGILYAVFSALFICVIGSDFLIFRTSHTAKIIMVILTFVSGFSASFLLCSKEKSPQKKYNIIKFTTLFLFLMYLTVVIDFTLIGDSFGRNLSNFFALSGKEKSLYLKEHINLVPFATVKLFINGYKGGHLSFFYAIENILGNLFVMAPLAFFMPSLFKFANTSLNFFTFIVLFVLTIEILQIFFLTGSADIDDLLLNTLGAVLTFYILKTKKISKKLELYTYGVWKTNIFKHL